MKKLAYFGLCLLIACSQPDLRITEISRDGDEIKRAGKEIYYNGNDTTILKYNPGISHFHNLDSTTNRIILINDNENNKNYKIYFGVDGIDGINLSSKNECLFYVDVNNPYFLQEKFYRNRVEISKDSLNKIVQEINDKYPLEERLN